MSSADEIRAKRLARLNTPSERSNERQQQQQSVQSTPVATSSQSEIMKEEQQPPIKQPKPEPEPESKQSKEDNLSQWIIVELEYVFHASLKYNDKNLIYLPNLSYEYQQQPNLNQDNIESIFMEILTEVGVPQQKVLLYLYTVYHAAFKTKRTLLSKSSFYEDKVSILNKIIELAISYGNMSFQIPDMFLNNNLKESIDLIIHRFADLSSFLTDIVNVAIEENNLIDLLNLIFPYLSSQLYQTNLNERLYLNLISVFDLLVSIKPVASIFSQAQGFQPPDSTKCLDYEQKTLLGPLLRLSPLLENMSTIYFSEGLSDTQIRNIYDSLQNEYKVIIDHLFNIINKLIRGSNSTREDILKWLANLINLSHLRRGSHADSKKLPSDAIMFNISVILIKLSLPFLDYPTFNKIDKIDIDYFVKSDLIDISEESRVNSTIEEAKQYQITDKTKPNFISDCFNLTLAYLHYGMGGIYLNFDKIKRQIKHLEERINMIESHTPNTPGLSPTIQLMERELPNLKKLINNLKAQKESIKAIFNFRNLQFEIFDFIIGAITFITRLIDPNHTYPIQSISIPIFQINKVSELDDHDFLKTKTPKPWKYYPEFLLEGIINYCKFITNFQGCPLLNNSEKLEKFVEFSIILLRCPELIGNPHMKAHLIEVLFIGSLPLQNGSPGFMANIFTENKLVRENILYSLLDFYVMVEKTGASSQFYDKFNSRYYISIILEELWKHTIYRLQLTDYSKHNVDFFVRFIARMLNDTTYLLDETFNLLNSIHNYQSEIKTRQLGNSPNEELGTDEELAKNLSADESRVKTYMQLSNKTMELFKLFTKETPKGFVLPEIVDRLAGMLDYNLSIMVGPKCSNLKVESPEKYQFEPKKILVNLCEIYVNLSNQQKFVIAVSRDGRSFNINYFKKAQNILMTKTFVDNKLIDKLVNFANKAEENRVSEENEELEMGDIPEEFLDPLMFTIMEDPVILPSSKINIDRSTIKAHLLSDSTDPFNRMPLSLDDVIDNVELRERIWEFKNKSKVGQDVEMEE
ncbi:unnamed protein product [Candida verbasci]|uniref:RING-type E3 ubiquitin transferase n=1 Tax=Candida verbasci TaxID=1227364 RepID=A0A9W4TVQ7_9ASCO|nr:unnamed protein product [Candida verbasci]